MGSLRPWQRASRADLSEAEREVWIAAETEGLRPCEIAEETGRSPSTVRTLLQRARRKVDR